MGKKSFYGISIVDNFFKFWSKYEGSKNHRCCRNFCLPKNIFFVRSNTIYVFNFRIFFPHFFLCKIIWLVVYSHFAVIFHFFVKMSTFCGLQIFLHKSTQNQQMLKKLSNSKSLTKIDVFLSPTLTIT